MDLKKIDMGEVLRLTRAGRLAQAVAHLRGDGRSAPQPEEDNDRRAGTPAGGDVIDMVAPAQPGGSWTPPVFTRSREPDEARDARNVPDFVRTILDRVGTLPTGPGLDGLPGLDRLPGLDGLPGLAPKAPPVPDGARFEERSFTNDAGTRPYKLYVPSGYAGGPAPLVVMLHGCTQSPDDFAAGTRMNELAEEQGFLVVYPGQPKTAHPQRCWKWFSAGDQQRGKGEPSLIAGITRAVMAEFSIDPARVYVAGMSAGGAAAAIMGSEYPDLYAAVGVHSGLACGAASDLPSALSAMRGGGAVPARTRTAIVPTIVFHGDRDATVHAANGEQVIAQQIRGDLRAVVTHGSSEAGIAFTRTAHTDEAGREWLVHWSLAGAGHAWAGGSPAGSYTDPRGPDASREMLRFFAGHARRAA